jgi:hypothetical protein
VRKVALIMAMSAYRTLAPGDNFLPTNKII